MSKHGGLDHIQSRRNCLTMSLSMFIAAATIFLLVSFDPSFSTDQQTQIFYLLILLAIAFLPHICIRWLKRSAVDCSFWLHPPVVISYWTLFQITIPGAVSFFYPDSLIELNEAVGVNYNYATLGMGLVLLGLICLWVGYAAGLRILHPIERMRHSVSSTPKQSRVALLYILAFIVSILQILVTGIGYTKDSSELGSFVAFDQWIGYIASYRYLILVIVSIQVLRGNWPKKWLAILIMIEIVFVATSGFVGVLLKTGIIVVAAAFYAGVNVRRYANYVVIFGLVMILLVPVSETIRARFNAGEFDGRSVVEVSNVALQALQSTWGTDVAASWDVVVNKVLGRQAVIAHTPGLIMLRTPSLVPYQGIGQLLAVPAYIVPRALWPDKPVLSQGIWFSTTYMNMPLSTRSSSAMTIFGQGYILAGWMGTATALFALGFLLAFIFQNTAGVGAFALYLALVPTIIQVEAEVTVMMVTLCQVLILNWLAYWFLLKHSSKRLDGSAIKPPAPAMRPHVPR